MHCTEETVFIVDDDASVRKSLIRLVRSAGWKVEGFTSSGEFLSRLPLSGNCCLILDLTLPDSSGFELYNQLAALGCSLPTIFLTGGSDSDLRKEAMGSGVTDCVDFFTKPVDATILLNAVQLAFDRDAPMASRESQLAG